MYSKLVIVWKSNLWELQIRLNKNLNCEIKPQFITRSSEEKKSDLQNANSQLQVYI